MDKKWDRLLLVLFENPHHTMTVRELAKRTKAPKSTTQRYLKELFKEGLVDNQNQVVRNTLTKFLKASFMIRRLFHVGLIDYLQSELAPATIVVFGSIRKGEYDSSSDIDIFIETPRKKQLNLQPFEKSLGHPIQLFVESSINNVPQELFHNIINGIKLTGYIQLKKRGERSEKKKRR